MSGYAELQVTSNFSFLRGASSPEELVRQAMALGHAAIAITDRNSLAGIVRAHAIARQVGLRFVVGCRLDFQDGSGLLCYPMDKPAYSRLTRLLTLGKRRAPKGQCHLNFDDLVTFGEGQIVVALPPEDWAEDFKPFLDRVAAAFPGRAYLAAQHLYRGDDARRLHRLAALSSETGLPMVATNDVLYHEARRRVMQDVVTCIREGCTLAEAGFRLAAHGERHPKPAAEMRRLFRHHEEAVARSLEIVKRCTFNLTELRYEYPHETTGSGRSAQEELVHLTWEGAALRYPEGIPDKVRNQVEHELELIAQLGYASYFLTVQDIVRFARSQEILCQGRGSAANSSVCFCLWITEVDPAKSELLFERFVSSERNEPPDIDVDFEHERREEVIQYIYRKYGRDRTSLAATVIHYRSRRAIREVSKVMGLSTDVAALLSSSIWGWSNKGIDAERVCSLGLDPEDRTLMLTINLIQELIGFPRHLSQHVGGFVITQGKLDELVPIENAAMKGRTIVEWDKDDLDELKILKVDVLALGMLSCVRRAFALIDRHYGEKPIPSESSRSKAGRK